MSIGLQIKVGDVRAVLNYYEIPAGFRNRMAKQIQQSLLQEMYSQVTRIARQELHTTRATYIDAVSVTKNAVELDGFLPNAIEDGAGAFDLKQAFANSNKKKLKKNGSGWYLTIPFRIMTPTAPDSKSTMSWEIYRAVLRGQKYNPGVAGSRPAFTDVTTGINYPEYQHKSPILAGIRGRGIPGTDLHSYNTFRRVSDKSDPNSWIHKGFIAKHIFEQAWQQVDVEGIINDYLE